MFASNRGAAAKTASLLALLVLTPVGFACLASTAAAEGNAPVVIAQNEPQPADEEEDFDPTTGGSSAEPPSDVEVIRIKGRGISALETDVPQSVTQFDAAEIEALGAQDISNLADITPNVEIRTAGATSPVFFIRGVGLSDFSANAAGAVAIYADDVPINAPAMQLGLIFDLENVIILRGPQGWGSNRNASAGVFKLISRKPTGELSAGLNAEGGKWGLQDYDGFIEVPIVEEILSARFSFRLRKREGYVENGCAGAPPFEDRFTVSHPGDLPTDSLGVVLPGFLNTEFNFKSFCGPPEALGGPADTAENLPRFVKSNGLPGQLQSIRFGTASDRYSIVPGGLPQWVNDQNRWAARGIFRIKPPDLDMDWLIKAHGSRLDQYSTVGQAIGTAGNFGQGQLGCRTSLGYIDRDIITTSPSNAPCGIGADASDLLATQLDANPWRGDFNRIGQTTLDIVGAAASGTWDLGPVTLKSVTAYDQYVRFRDQDNDFTPDIIFESIVNDNAHQWFQEINASGELTETPFKWNMGGYYLKEVLFVRNEADTIAVNTDSIRTFTQEVSSWAVYGDFSWEFLDDFTLEGGVRWQAQANTLNFVIAPRTSSFPPPASIFEEAWAAPTGGITLTYRFSDDVSAYWKYTRGWKPGTFNTSAQSGRRVSVAEPELIDSFETGVTGNWFDGSLFIRANFFYYNYENKQEFVVDDEPGAPPTLRVINALGAEVFGVEAEVRVQPLTGWVPSEFDGLILTVRPGWLEAHYLEFSTDIIRPKPFIGAIPIIVDFTGNRAQNAPQFSVSGTAEWTFDLGRFGAIIPRYDFSWRDDAFFDTNESLGSPNQSGNFILPKHTIGQRSYVLHNVRLSYRSPEGNIELYGWAQNIMNKAYKQTAFDASQFSNLTVNFIGTPRTFGFGASYLW